jgi:hypothetical protein
VCAIKKVFHIKRKPSGMILLCGFKYSKMLVFSVSTQLLSGMFLTGGRAALFWLRLDLWLVLPADGVFCCSSRLKSRISGEDCPGRSSKFPGDSRFFTNKIKKNFLSSLPSFLFPLWFAACLSSLRPKMVANMILVKFGEKSEYFSRAYSLSLLSEPIVKA